MKLTPEEVIKRVDSSGSHFFDAGTMRFFRSRVGPDLCPTFQKTKNSKVFYSLMITSEVPPHGVRGYTVRLIKQALRKYGKWAVQFDTMGDFREFPTLGQARTFVKWLAQGLQ
jgi:hypothetical protein